MFGYWDWLLVLFVQSFLLIDLGSQPWLFSWGKFTEMEFLGQSTCTFLKFLTYVAKLPTKWVRVSSPRHSFPLSWEDSPAFHSQIIETQTTSSQKGGLGRAPGEGKGYPLQYSGLENFMDCIVYAVANSQTRMRDFHFHFQMTLAPPSWKC